MTKSTYPTKYQLEHLKKRINSEIDPLIDQAQLSVKSIVADLTESAELKLAKKIKADVVIKELEKAIQELEIKREYLVFIRCILISKIRLTLYRLEILQLLLGLKILEQAIHYVL